MTSKFALEHGLKIWPVLIYMGHIISESIEPDMQLVGWN